MKNDTIFLYLIASVSFLFALYNALAFWAKRNMTGKQQEPSTQLLRQIPKQQRLAIQSGQKSPIGWMGKSMFQEIAYKSP